MPKNRVRFSTKGAPCRQSTQSLLISSRVSSASPHCPALIDVRTDEDYECRSTLFARRIAPPHEIRFGLGLGVRRSFGHRHRPRAAEQDSEGVAAWLRHAGASFCRRSDGRAPGLGQSGRCRSFQTAKVPPRDALGRTIWVTRSRPKVDRIACPWLIHRFRRSKRRLSLRRTSGSVSGCGTFRWRGFRHRGCVLEPQG